MHTNPVARSEPAPWPASRPLCRPRQVAAPLVLLLLFALAARAELIDRIAVSVGNRVITQSDLERQIRVIAFQNGVKPDLSPANKRAVADKMIEQKLIQRELENTRYPMPAASELAPAIEEFKKTHFPDDAAYQRALAEYHITEQDLLDVLLWERTLLRFIQIRFESGVLVTDQEAADYAQAAPDQLGRRRACPDLQPCGSAIGVVAARCPQPYPRNCPPGGLPMSRRRRILLRVLTAGATAVALLRPLGLFHPRQRMVLRPGAYPHHRRGGDGYRRARGNRGLPVRPCALHRRSARLRPARPRAGR